MAVALQQTPWYKRLWDALGHYGKVRTLWQLALAFTAAARAVAKLPGGWYPPQYWAVAGAVFFGTWALLFTVVAIIEKVWSAVSRWRELRKFPPKVVLTVHGGHKAILQLEHRGAPMTYSATGRLLKLTEGYPNPAPALFEAMLIRMGTQPAATEVELEDGQFAHIVVAGIVDTDHGNSFYIRRGPKGVESFVPSNTATIEFCVRPSLLVDAACKVKVVRDGPFFLKAAIYNLNEDV